MNEDLIKEWKAIKKELELANQTVNERQYFLESDNIPSNKTYELHVFADSSIKAYGAAVYLIHGEQSALVIAKSRVKPLKEITLPRLELLTTFVAAHLLIFVKKALCALNIEKTVMWSDSQIVLYWINSEKKLPLFVENRVKFIRQTPIDEIKYCPSQDNPADLLTRGLSCKELSELWKYCPPWLPQGNWPVCEVFTVSNDDLNQIDSSINQKSQPFGVERVIEINRFDSKWKLLRVTAYVLRFISQLRNRNTRNSQNEVKPKYLSVTEIKRAEHLWIKAIQTDTYAQELQTLNKKTKKVIPLIQQLRLFVDEDGLLRCGGRLQNADVRYDAKYPILIPGKHYFSELVVKDAHMHMLHDGLESTVSHIRQTFWIPKIRQVVKSVLRKCATCLKVNGKSYQIPVVPPLPKCRLENAPPFTICGVDFTGALYYKTEHSNTSLCIPVYMCSNHLEIVTDDGKGLPSSFSTICWKTVITISDDF